LRLALLDLKDAFRHNFGADFLLAITPYHFPTIRTQTRVKCCQSFCKGADRGNASTCAADSVCGVFFVTERPLLLRAWGIGPAAVNARPEER
jgi:hypothetical protein